MEGFFCRDPDYSKELTDLVDPPRTARLTQKRGLPSDISAAEVPHAIVHQRYKLSRAIVVPSNRLVQDWGKYPGDATLATDSRTSSCLRRESESGLLIDRRSCLWIHNEPVR